MATTLSRRGFLAGLIAAPAVLKLGIHMPVKPGLEIAESTIIIPEAIIAPPQIVTLLVPQQHPTVRAAMAEIQRMLLGPDSMTTIKIADGHVEPGIFTAGQFVFKDRHPNRKARRRALAMA